MSLCVPVNNCPFKPGEKEEGFSVVTRGCSYLVVNVDHSSLSEYRCYRKGQNLWFLKKCS